MRTGGTNLPRTSFHYNLLAQLRAKVFEMKSIEASTTITTTTTTTTSTSNTTTMTTTTTAARNQIQCLYMSYNKQRKEGPLFEAFSTRTKTFRVAVPQFYAVR